MQVDELYGLTIWIQSAIVEAEIAKKFENLQQALLKSVEGSQELQPLEEKTEQLLSALREVPLSELSMGQLHVLSTIGIGTHVGPDAVSMIEDVLLKSAFDMGGVEEKISAFMKEIRAGIQWSAQSRQALSGIIESEEVHGGGEGVLLRIHFAGEAQISNLTELKGWASEWWEIGRGISMAYNETPENIKVVGAGRALETISLMMPDICAKAIARIVSGLLRIEERVTEIKEQAAVIRGMHLRSDSAERSLLEEAEIERAENLENVIQFEIHETGLDAQSAEGAKSKALDNAVRLVSNFFEQGGEVDFVVPREPEGSGGEYDESREARDELRTAVKETRELAIGSRSKESDSETDFVPISEELATAPSGESSKQTGGLGTRSLPKHNGSE